jgi:predicted phosphodiesterase
MIGDCVVVNPGEISASKTGKATYVIYDTESNEVEFFEVENCMTLRTEIVKGFYRERKTKN